MIYEIQADDNGKVLSAIQKYVDDGYIKEKQLDRAEMGKLGIDMLNAAWAGGEIE